jgi:glycosyltransferase involved in cell wall biosynthesis
MTPRVAVVHPHLVAGGGSEAVALGAIQALQDDHRVTLITMGRPDLQALNGKYGTDIDTGKFETRFLAIPPGMKTRFDALRGFRLARYCRRHAREYDVMISAYNVMDFGVPGIQMIADFSFDDDVRRELDFESGAAGNALHKASAGRSIYLGLARALAGDREVGWKRNRTVANSEWTRGLLRERFGLDSEVIYPPVVGDFPRLPWSEREAGFVFMGRLAPEKGIRSIIEILGDVRKEKPVHLHILGRRGPTAYARELEDLRRQHGDWVHLEGEMYGPEKAAFLAGHKYGISGCRREAFGIAVAEMVKARCLVWVPDGGGQTEIVDHPGLVYTGRDHAVSLILGALGAAAAETGLRRHLEARAEVFSSTRFAGEMRSLVRDFLNGGSVGAA